MGRRKLSLEAPPWHRVEPLANTWKAAHEFRADLSRAFVVGDNVGDSEMGKRVVATTILVRTGYGARVVVDGMTRPDYVVDNLLEAAHVIGRVVTDRGGRYG